MSYLIPSYDPWVVVASLSIAFLASYVALDLVERIRANGTRAARLWWLCGSVAMGTGIWSMHFVGMLAYTLPITLGYTGGMTLLSWLAAVAVSSIALGVAGRGEAAAWRITAGALVMGAGICAMHYTGMAALDMAPGIVWNGLLIAASAAIATGAAAAALLIFFGLQGVHGVRRRQLYKAAAAVVMGLAISGMHYTGMAAASFPANALCLSANQLGGSQLGGMVMLASGALLSLTLFTSMLDSRLQHKTSRLADSLKQANSELQSANDELKRRTFLDPLTGLPNRLLFEDRLEHALARSQRDGGQAQPRLAVLFVDLDGFKPVNDSLGHAAGDHVLRAIAERLRHVARERDTVARIGGDEFVLLLEDLRDETDAAAFARRVVATVCEPIEHQGRSLQVNASVGIAVHPDHGAGDRLMVHADAAMYAAKRAGGNTYALFEAHMNSDALHQLSLQTDLRQALKNGQLSLHYQPKLDSHSGRIHSAEALLRWQHPERGPVPPTVFIAVAERFGLIQELGNWVIEEACRQLRCWDDHGLHLRVAINLSVHQLRQDDLVDRIAAALERHRIDASRLLCEITESMAMEDTQATQRALDGLGRLGVYLSIDDFGTGHSSLSYLRKLPARQLKIDKSFIHDLDTDRDARAVVDAVIKLAHALDLSVVAEGVETEAQRDILVELQCDELQGYLIARPLPPEQLMAWTTDQRPANAPAFSASVFGDDEPHRHAA
ncbi:bifunctional diguanylate cyclase/phosphodiesterase [Rhizobacter sp. J219]|uniref:putative bifunctional diguanylate cyclase/phosphodiesterase n=1 Tax=Rhizobacter sp. J219 TaxID=2898430 RepID=UPI00215123BC|nr:bifunctional diguanylate cyclase/phosphodiesterase [Rhizobacter sp. J219]MCR5881501.1 bifunctional diguanylate cyclase/phosphodiesterase [Rhizobacter sp. J219]